MSERGLRKRFLELLERDKEFRHAVAGLLGLGEILQRLDKNEKQLVKLRRDLRRGFKLYEEEMARLREDMKEGFRRHGEEIARIWEELAKLREDMQEGFKRHDEEIAKIWEELTRLREDMIMGFKRHDEELAKLRQDMLEGFKRHDEEIAKIWEEMARLREDMKEGFRRHDEELVKLREDMKEGFRRHEEEMARLREDMKEGFALLERRVSALGARWGLMSEAAFREGLRSLVEKEFGFRVSRWVRFDERGVVYGYPSQVEIDVAVHDERIILVEIKSNVRASDVYTFKRKAELYEELEGRKPSRLVLVTPYAEEEAVEAARHLGVEICTEV
ncbi:MAG: DUF3782 domain-containing protein [Thermofilum sp.]